MIPRSVMDPSITAAHTKDAASTTHPQPPSKGVGRIFVWVILMASKEDTHNVQVIIIWNQWTMINTIIEPLVQDLSSYRI